VPAALEPIELLLEELGGVLLDDELALGGVLLVSGVVLPVVPDVDAPLDEPIMAFVSV
jgi:hypothetical protein